MNFGRDLPAPETVDIRNVIAGDPAPDGKGTLSIARGIEVGHIFQLGTKYSKAMNAVVLGEDGKSHTMPMGCYGIGVSRIVAAAIEQNHDEHGICWPEPIAPFQVALLPMNAKKSHRVREAAENLYAELQAAGVEVLLDDRNIRPGVMFNDMELIGIPHRVVIGERGLANGEIEYRARTENENRMLPLDGIVDFLRERIAEATYIPQFGAEGEVRGFFAIFHDITEHRQAEERIRQLAHYDALTGLPNRALFRDRLEQAIMHAERADSYIALMFIDLDNFKAINDSLGHLAGDELLCEVADRLRGCMRAEDTVANHSAIEALEASLQLDVPAMIREQKEGTAPSQGK